MVKMRGLVFADIQILKLIFSQEKIQKLKKIGRQIVASTVIVSILGVDIVYAMVEGAPKTAYVKFKDSDEKADGKTNALTPFREGQGQLPASLAGSLTSSSEDEETTEGEGLPTSSLVSPSDDGQTNPGTSSPDKNSSYRSSSPTGNSSGEEEGDELKTFNSIYEDEEDLSELERKSLSDLRKEMLENFLNLDLEKLNFEEKKKDFWDKLEACLKIPFEKLKKAASKKMKGYSVVGDKQEPLLPQEDEYTKKTRAFFKKIEGTSLDDFGKYVSYLLKKGFSLLQWASFGPTTVMSAGTAMAMSIIVVGSIYNKYFTPDFDNPTEYNAAIDFSDYINVTEGILTFIGLSIAMTRATSPSTRRFVTSKSGWEIAADLVLIPLAMPQGLFFLFLFYDFEQHNKEVTDSEGFTPAYDGYFTGGAIGYGPRLAVGVLLGMLEAINRWFVTPIYRCFHSDIPVHVKEHVRALRQLEERIDYDLSDSKVTELCDFLKSSSFEQQASKLSPWWNHFVRGKVSDMDTVDNLLTYLCLIQYAKAEMEKEPEEPRTCNVKTTISRSASALGLPAAFSIIAISLYELFVNSAGSGGALAIGLVFATLGLLPGWMLQSHRLESTIEGIKEEFSGITSCFKSKAHFMKALKDPYTWVNGICKPLAKSFGFVHNALTNLLPVLVALAVLVPDVLGGDEETQQAITGLMLGIATPFLLTEGVIGTHEIGEIVMTIPWAALKGYLKVSDFVTIHCLKKTPSKFSFQERDFLKQKLKALTATTLKIAPEDMANLDFLREQLVNGSVCNNWNESDN